MVRAFTGEPLAAGTSERLVRAACRAPSAGFSQGYSFLVLEGEQQAAPLWEIFYEDAPQAGAREKEGRMCHRSRNCRAAPYRSGLRPCSQRYGVLLKGRWSY